MQTKLNFFKKWPSQSRANLAKYFDIKKGYTSFIHNKTVQVGHEKFTADRIIIDAGNKPNKLSISGSELTHNSYEAFALKKLPRRIALIGAGYVSMELATIICFKLLMNKK